jgi:hypothetical protein
MPSGESLYNGLPFMRIKEPERAFQLPAGTCPRHAMKSEKPFRHME